MFDSGISAYDLIKEIKNEADIAYTVEDISYIRWLNELEQLLYTECIREQKEIKLAYNVGNVIDLSSLPISNDENNIRFEDIHTVYSDTVQLIKTTLASGIVFSDVFYKADNKLCLNIENSPRYIRIIYYVKPKLKTEKNIFDTNIMLPVEFMELVKAKLRGEAYKIANEDNLASKWINDYNVLVENFKTWIGSKCSEFGL